MTKPQGETLKFKKAILSSAKEPISQKELLDRLDSLSTELSKVEQDHFNVKSLDKIKDNLINKKLLAHKDTGVQSLVACCLSDVLRIYAPDAPYTDAELAEIFKLFIKQFKKLADSDNGYYAQQVYLITRLAEVRSIILVTDIDSGSQLIESIFQLFYDQTNVFHKKLEPIIADILIEIISEWDQISTPVLKLILNRFLTAAKQQHSVTTSLSTSATQPFNLSISICNANPDRLARQLTKFFSEVLYENTSDGEVDYSSLTKLHTLLVEVWKNVPEILGSVMGLLDDELNADSEKFRALATETVGKLLASQARINFITVHRDTWLGWMKKTLDISPQVRVKWVEQAAEVLSNRSDVLSEITTGLSKTLIDADEHVRLATVKAIASIPADILLRKIHNTSILTGLVQLAREKHSEIREEAIAILGSLYKDAYDDAFAENTDDLNETYKLVKEIPNHLLSLYYINDKDINYLVDMSLMEEILPFETDDAKRVERLLNVVSSLDEKSMASFIAFNKRQQQLSGVISKFVEFCEELNGNVTSNDEVKQKFEKTVNWLSVSLPDKYSPRDSLHKFATLNNRRTYALIKWCTSNESDYSAIVNARKELFKRLQDAKSLSASAIKDMESTFKIVIYRSSLTVFNRSNISSLLSFSDDDNYSKAAHQLIENISSITPTAFQNQIENLVAAVKEEKEGSKLNTLRALFHIFRKLTEYIPNDDTKFLDVLAELGKTGSPVEAEFAIKVLSLTDKLEAVGTSIFDDIYPLDLESEHIAAHLSTIAELFSVCPVIPEEYAEDMTPHLVKDVLLSGKAKGKKSDPEWVDDEALENGKERELSSKILALRVFTKRLRSLDKDDPEDDTTVTTTAENVLKLLLSLIAKGGEILNSKAKNYPSPRHYQARLRLEAGLCLLELAESPRFNSLMKPVVIDRIILLIQDENEHIRSRFIKSLTGKLKSDDISNKFLPAIYFMAYEPNSQLKGEVKTWIRSTFTKRSNTGTDGSDIVFEKTITGLIHAISHHAEFVEYVEAANDESTEDSAKEESMLKALTFALEYIAFFLENVVTEKNISLVYYFANRVKQYRDATLPESSYTTESSDVINNLYRVSDLTLLSIRDLGEARGWTIQTYPGKLHLSAELFAKMKSTEEGHKVVGTSYIPDSIIKRLGGIVKQKINSISTTKRVRTTDVSVQKKKQKSSSVKKDKKDKKYRKRTTSDSGSDADVGTKVEHGPVRKSSRAKRIDYVDQVKEYVEGEDEEVDDDESMGEDEL